MNSLDYPAPSGNQNPVGDQSPTGNQAPSGSQIPTVDPGVIPVPPIPDADPQAE